MTAMHITDQYIRNADCTQHTISFYDINKLFSQIHDFSISVNRREEVNYCTISAEDSRCLGLWLVLRQVNMLYPVCIPGLRASLSNTGKNSTIITSPGGSLWSHSKHWGASWERSLSVISSETSCSSAVNIMSFRLRRSAFHILELSAQHYTAVYLIRNGIQHSTMLVGLLLQH